MSPWRTTTKNILPTMGFWTFIAAFSHHSFALFSRRNQSQLLQE